MKKFFTSLLAGVLLLPTVLAAALENDGLLSLEEVKAARTAFREIIAVAQLGQDKNANLPLSDAKMGSNQLPSDIGALMSAYHANLEHLLLRRLNEGGADFAVLDRIINRYLEDIERKDLANDSDTKRTEAQIAARSNPRVRTSIVTEKKPNRGPGPNNDGVLSVEEVRVARNVARKLAGGFLGAPNPSLPEMMEIRSLAGPDAEILLAVYQSEQGRVFSATLQSGNRNIRDVPKNMNEFLDEIEARNPATDPAVKIAALRLAVMQKNPGPSISGSFLN